ncbi:MAG: hydroxymyristoyl-ACP dehydratase [Bacteroidales bacterium]
MGVFEKAVIFGDQIVELIPQRAPFVFVDAFYGESDSLFQTGFTPGEVDYFVVEGFLTEPGVIEHMAQSAAASSGWSYRERGEKIPVGFIGAVADFELTCLPVSGVEIRTTIRFSGEFGGISLVEAESFQNGESFAKGKLKIFIDKEKEQ